jgi:hypothetical protein
MRQTLTGNPPTWVRRKYLEKKDSPDKDYITDIDDRVQGKKLPYIEEPSLLHPFNTSLIKIRNNGMIDLFVSFNQGIRIDPGQKTISEITNGLKQDLGYFHAWVNNFAHWFVEREIWQVVEQGNYRLDTEMEIEQVSETYTYHEAIEDMSLVAGKKFNAQSIDNLTLSTFAEIIQMANGDILIEAGKPPSNPAYKDFPGVTVYETSASNKDFRIPGAEDHTEHEPEGEEEVSDITIRATGNIILEATGDIIMKGKTIQEN